MNSYIPSTVPLWNQLPNPVKESNTISSFKYNLSKVHGPSPVPTYYYVGTRKGQILHARLRMSCSSLNHHLFSRNIVNNPFCTCGEIETTSHYLVYCQNYSDLRANLENILNFPLTYEVLLYGDTEKNFEFNKNVFIQVQNFIISTRRFALKQMLISRHIKK